MKFCPNCGSQIADTAKFCTNCGSRMGEQAPVQQAPAVPAAPVAPAATAVMEEPAVQTPVQAPVQQAAPQDDFWGAPAQPAASQDDFWGAPAPAAPQPEIVEPEVPAVPVQQPQYQAPQVPQQQPMNYTQRFMQQKQAQQNQAPQQPQVHAPNSYSQAAQQIPRAAVPVGGQPKKFMAILAYFGFLFLIPLFAAKNDPLARYHTNQGLVLFIISFLSSNLSNLLGNLLLKVSPILTLLVTGLFGIIGLICFVFSIMGIINAAKGHAKPLPLIGKIRILK